MAKLINLSEMYQICEKKKRNSDFILLSEVLGISQMAAYSRFKRGNNQAVKAMYTIITEREVMTNKIKQEFSKDI